MEYFTSSPDKASLHELTNGDICLSIEKLNAGYGKMKILHDFNLLLGKGQSLCLIGPNGAGKSTVLHSIFGMNTIFSGHIKVSDENGQRDITSYSPKDKLVKGKIAYVLQENSLFPNMTVEENLQMGGFTIGYEQTQKAMDHIFTRYTRLAVRRTKQAKVLSGGERRLLEFARALMTEPEIILVDEPSIGLEPKTIDSVFESLRELQEEEKKTIILVEQNAKKGLEFADIGYVLTYGKLVLAGKGDDMLTNPQVAKAFLGAK